MDFSALLLVVHLFIALSMVGIILLQPSDGGGTGLGSDSGATAMSQVRGKGSFLTRTTWYLGAAFMAVALLLAWLSRADLGAGSVARDLLNQQPSPIEAPAQPAAPLGDAFEVPATDSGTSN